MRMQPATPPPTPPPARRGRPSGKFLLAVLVLLALAFLAGYVPPTLEARRVEQTLRKTEVDLQMANLHRQVGVAALEAQRMNYQLSAQAAARFFDGCRRVVESGAFASQPRTATALSAYAGRRDEVMGLLALGSPEATAELSGIFLAMEGVIERKL